MSIITSVYKIYFFLLRITAAEEHGWYGIINEIHGYQLDEFSLPWGKGRLSEERRFHNTTRDDVYKLLGHKKDRMIIG